MSVLIPILSKKENTPEFLEKAVKGEKEVFLLAIMDTNALSNNFGFATSEIGAGSELIEQIKAKLEPKKIKVIEALEWGDTNTQIIHLAKLKNIKKIALVKQENKYFKDLVKELNENKIKTQIF